MGYKRTAIFLLLLSAAFFTWYAVFVEADRSLRLIALDVGQGDAIFIETPEGNQILIDGGYGARVLGELGDVMPPYDKSIDIVIATHTDSDHIGGLRSVLETYDVGMFVENGFLDDSGTYADVQRLLRDHGVSTTTVQAGDRIVFGRDVFFDVLGPFPEDLANTKAPNETMIVGRLRFKNASALLEGDLEKADELRLALSSADLQSDVLKVAHHGSRTSSTGLFLAKVKPFYAIVSVGADNRYGHPHADVIERIRAFASTILRTDQNGRVEVRTTGERFFLLGGTER